MNNNQKCNMHNTITNTHKYKHRTNSLSKHVMCDLWPLASWAGGVWRLRITIHSRRESGDVVILTTFELHEGYRDALIAIGSDFLGAKLCIIGNCGRLGRLDCMEKHTLFILILLYLFLSWGLVSMYPAHYITCSPYYITKNCNNYSAAQALCDWHGALYY